MDQITSEPSPDQAREEFKYKAEILNKYPPSRPLPAFFFRGPSDSGTEIPNGTTITNRDRVRVSGSSRSLHLEPSECDFWQLEAIEIAFGRGYEMGREAVALERHYKQRPDAKRFPDSQWLDKRVEITRQAWGITGFTSSVRENPTWFQFPRDGRSFVASSIVSQAPKFTALRSSWTNRYEGFGGGLLSFASR